MLKRRKVNRAFALILSLVFVFILLTLTLGLFVSQQSSALQQLGIVRRFGAMRLALEADAALNLALRKATSSQNPLTFAGTDRIQAGGVPDMTARLDWGAGIGRDSLSAAVPTGMASSSNLFDSDALNPYGAFGYADESRTTVWGDTSIPAWTTAARVKTPGDRDFCVSLAPGLPYAVYSGTGEVDIEGDVFGWSNPTLRDTLTDKAAPLDPVYHSGVPVHVAARGDVRVAGVYENGRVYSQRGRVSLAPRSTALGVLGKVPVTDPFTSLYSQLDAVHPQLSSVALDKSGFIFGGVVGVESFFDMLTGGADKWYSFLSMEQATKFPWIPIPGFQEDELWTVVALHVPYPPMKPTKFLSVDAFAQLIKDMINLKRTWKAAKQVAEDAEKALADAGKSLADIIEAGWDILSGQYKKAKKKYDDAKDAAKQAEDALSDAWQSVLDDVLGPLNDFKNDILNLGIGKVPETIYEDEQWGKSNWGWAYAELVKKFLDLGIDFFKAVIDGAKTKDFEALFNDVFTSVRLVHFGDRGPTGILDSKQVSRAQFPDGGGFTLCATWNVPRGRTLKWYAPGQTFTVMGDLWIQRGATLVVDGNLRVQAPDVKNWAYREAENVEPDESDPFFPKGRIFLEEGASLVVTGNLEAEGDEELGTVVVGGKIGSEHPLTSGVYCLGDMKLKYGTGSGVPLDDFIYYYAQKGPGVVKSLYDRVIDPFFEDVGALAARIVGPFHRRDCWFAKYATTFVIVPELVEIGAQGPWPIPLMYENCAPKVFSPLSLLYQVELNAVLGPNLMTHSDWWLLGWGQVPFLPKVPSLLTQESVFAGLSDDWEQLGKDVGKRLLDDFVKDVLPAILQDILTSTVTVIVQNMVGSGIETTCGGAGTSAAAQGAEKAEKSILKEIIEKSAEKIKVELKEEFKTIMKYARSEVYAEIGKDIRSQTLTQEVAGTVLFSRGRMELGEEEGKGMMVAGLIVANGDVRIRVPVTIGCVMSLNGNVELQNFAYYPYFTQASAYIPVDFNTFVVNTGKIPGEFAGLVALFKDIVYPLTPEGGSTVDITSGFYQTIARGWRR